MRKIILTFLGVLIYFVSVQCQDWKDLLLNQDKRIVPEWEPALGAVISWTSKVPKDLIRTIAENDIAYILVSSSAEVALVQSQMNTWGIPESNYVIFNQVRGISYPWVRDWGSLSVFNANGDFSFYDGVFDYPVAYQNNTISYWLCSSGDNCAIEDSSFQQIADYLGVPRVDLPFALTGGNAAFDGLGKFYTTEIYEIENLRYGYTLPEAESILQDELGIGNIDIIQNYMALAIQHIDCLLIFLNPEHILVLKVPPSYPTYNTIENIVTHLKTLTNSFGRPYKISRIETDYFSGDDVASYTNSLILNNNIYVPLYGIPEDDDALSTYEDLMPGYNVYGFLHTGGYRWQEGDALHCRTKQVHDPQMLRIVHKPLGDTIALQEEYEILVYIRDYSNTGLSSKTLNWKMEGESTWNQNTLVPTGDNYFYKTTIGGFSFGEIVEYYISASDNSGRAETSPPGAPCGYYSTLIAAGASNFQSAKSGQWNSNTTWKYFTGTRWTTPEMPPDKSNSNTIFINSNHSITVNPENLATGNQLVIRSGGSLTIEHGGQATITSLDNNGILNLESSDEGIASLMVDSYSGSGITNIHLYLTGDDEGTGWHYISPPVTSVDATVFSERANTAIAKYDESLITDDEDNGWVTSLGYHYNTMLVNPEWELTQPPWDKLYAGKGYYYYASATTPSDPDDPDALIINGTINTDDIEVDLDYNSGGGTEYQEYQGWNLVGNPFTCGIDWDNVVYANNIWDDTESAIYFRSNGTVYAHNQITVPEFDGYDGSEIPPMQGFFIKTNASGQKLAIPGSAKIHTDHPVYKNRPALSMIRLEIENSGMTDQAVISFNDNATHLYDNLFDARKLFAPEDAPYIHSSCDGNACSINTVPFPESSDTIPLVINASREGQYTIKAKQMEGLKNYKIYLFDKDRDYTVELSEDELYSFTSSPGKYTDRFVLIVSNVFTGIPEDIISVKPFNIYTSTGQINIQTLSDDWSGRDGEIKVFDLTGRLLSHRANIEFHRDEIKQFPLKVQSGIYIVQIASGQMRYVNRVFIK